jgi:hypothetical protein
MAPWTEIALLRDDPRRSATSADRWTRQKRRPCSTGTAS